MIDEIEFSVFQGYSLDFNKFSRFMTKITLKGSKLYFKNSVKIAQNQPEKMVVVKKRKKNEFI